MLFPARDPAPIRAALLAYGFAPAQLDAELADTLTAFALLHRFGDVRSVPATSARVPCDWPEAVRTLFPIA